MVFLRIQVLGPMGTPTASMELNGGKLFEDAAPIYSKVFMGSCISYMS